MISDVSIGVAAFLDNFQINVNILIIMQILTLAVVNQHARCSLKTEKEKSSVVMMSFVVLAITSMNDFYSFIFEMKKI